MMAWIWRRLTPMGDATSKALRLFTKVKLKPPNWRVERSKLKNTPTLPSCEIRATCCSQSRALISETLLAGRP